MNDHHETNLPEGKQLREEKIVVESLYEKSVKDRNGTKIGPVENVFLDEVYGQPEWISVKVGFLGSKTVFIPISALENLTDEEMVVPWDKEIVLESPKIKTHGDLTKEDEIALFDYYNIDYVKTSDDEVIDIEAIDAEEKDEVNAPGTEFESEDGKTPNMALVQEEMTEERRDHVIGNHGDARLHDTHRGIVEEERKSDHLPPAVGAAEADEIRDAHDPNHPEERFYNEEDETSEDVLRHRHDDVKTSYTSHNDHVENNHVEHTSDYSNVSNKGQEVDPRDSDERYFREYTPKHLSHEE